MDVVFNPISFIALSGSIDENYVGTITFTNNEKHDVKYKIRTNLPERVLIDPKSAVIEGNCKRRIEITYKCSADKVVEQKLMFKVFLISLKNIKDSDTVFDENKDLTEERMFQAVVMDTPEENDMTFLSPMASKESCEGNTDFTKKTAKNIRWLKK